LVAEGLSFRSPKPDAFQTTEPKQAPRRHRSLADRIDDWFWDQHRKAVEARLAQAKDLVELERLTKALDRGEIVLHP
jgi:hypothetical protein